MEFTEGINPFLWFSGLELIFFHGHSWRKGKLEYRNLHKTTEVFYSVIGYIQTGKKGEKTKTTYQCLILTCPVFNEVARLLEPKPQWEVEGLKEFKKLLKKVREKNDRNR